MRLSTPVDQRRNVLEFCLAPLRIQLGEETNGGLPATITIHGESVDLDGWEQVTLQEGLVSGSGSAKPWTELVTEGIAFRVGCKLKVASFINKTCDSQTLITFVAAGLALATELQQMVDLLIVAGQVGSAKKLTQFRNKIKQDVKTLRRLLADEEYHRAEQASADLIGPPKSALPVSSSVGRSPKGAGEYKPRRRDTANPFFSPPVNASPEVDECEVVPELDPTGQPRRVRRMGLFLIASTMVWMIFFMPRLFEPRAQVLEKLQFEHLPEVTTVTARPPSLYIEVQPQAWDALDTRDRRKLLEEIGHIAVSAEYNGVQVRKEQGDVVGRWLREEGARLVSGS